MAFPYNGILLKSELNRENVRKNAFAEKLFGYFSGIRTEIRNEMLISWSTLQTTKFQDVLSNVHIYIYKMLYNVG